MLGDFSFSIMPSLVSEDKQSLPRINNKRIKNIIWKLEDAILEMSSPKIFSYKILERKISLEFALFSISHFVECFGYQ